MKIFLAVSMMLLSAFVFGCSPDNSNPLAPQDDTIQAPTQTAEVNFRFQTAVSHNDSTNAIEITFTPDSSGGDGDGFCVYIPRLVVNAKPYFLPEGQVLSLPDGKYYSLQVYRAYLSDKGIVVGNENSPTFNINSSSLTSADQLALSEVDSYSFLVEPRVNMQMNSKIFNVDFYGYIGVPIYCDLIKVSFIGGYRSQVKPTNVYLPGRGGDETFNENYSILTASGLVIDNLHNRIIKSPSRLVYY